MSFILDALRKSDARRRMGETPGLASSPAPGSGGLGKRRRRRSLLLIVALVVALAITLVIIQPAPVSDRIQQWVGGAPASAPVDQLSDEDSHQSPPVEPYYERLTTGEDRARRQLDEVTAEQGMPRERMISDPAEIDAELARLMAEQAGEERVETKEAAEETQAARRERRTAPTPRTSVVAESPSRQQQMAVDPRDTERMERLMRAREARLAEAEAGSRARSAGRETAADAGSPDQPSERWSPSAAEYVRVWELPLSIRRSLPELRLSIHVFAVEEDQRFVLVNGERFVTGDMILNNVHLVEIRREGAVVDFRDYRFLLEP